MRAKLRAANDALKAGDIARAIRSYAELAQLAPEDSELHRRAGRELLGRGRLTEACTHFALAAKVEPENAELLYNYGLAELGRGRAREAVELLRRAARLAPRDVTTRFQFASALLASGDVRSAIPELRAALEIEPHWPYAANHLAWILSTHPDSSFRNGEEAALVAEGMCAALESPSYAMVATLAAAYAEAGRFDDAVRANDRAIRLAESAGEGKAAEALRARKRLYASRRAYRDPALEAPSRRE